MSTRRGRGDAFAASNPVTYAFSCDHELRGASSTMSPAKYAFENERDLVSGIERYEPG